MEKSEWKNLSEGRAWAEKFAARLKRPCVVLLSGEMGAGKTQLVRWWTEALGGHTVASPTFAIHHSYALPAGNVDHVDLYRLTSDADLESSGFWDLLVNDQALLFVEWADRLPGNVWPAAWTRLKVRIEPLPGVAEGRRVEVTEL